jgi:hypothetical protein
MTTSAYWHANKERLSEKHREWAAKQRAAGSVAMKRYNLKKAFKITLEQFFDLLDEQEGGCAICGFNDWTEGAPRNSTTAPCVDHCHISGKVRGILCSPCNHMLGKAQDNADRLRRAADYLEAPR